MRENDTNAPRCWADVNLGCYLRYLNDYAEAPEGETDEQAMERALRGKFMLMGVDPEAGFEATLEWVAEVLEGAAFLETAPDFGAMEPRFEFNIDGVEYTVRPDFLQLRLGQYIDVTVLRKRYPDGALAKNIDALLAKLICPRSVNEAGEGDYRYLEWGAAWETNRHLMRRLTLGDCMGLVEFFFAPSKGFLSSSHTFSEMLSLVRTLSDRMRLDFTSARAGDSWLTRWLRETYAAGMTTLLYLALVCSPRSMTALSDNIMTILGQRPSRGLWDAAKRAAGCAWLWARVVWTHCFSAGYAHWLRTGYLPDK